MSVSKATYPTGILLALLGPIGRMCYGEAIHVNEALRGLVQGGLNITEWLHLLTPHGMDSGVVMVRWGQPRAGVVTARIGWDDEGEPWVIDVVRSGDGWEGLPVPGPGDGARLLLATCSGGVVHYSLEEAIEWVLSLESEDKPVLPGPGYLPESGEESLEADWGDLADRFMGNLRRSERGDN